MNHITDAIIQDFLSGRLSPKEASDLQTHLKSCAQCHKHFDEQMAMDELLLSSLPPSQSRFSDDEWRGFLDTAHETVYPQKEKQIRFPRFLYALAAGLLIFLGLFFTYRARTSVQKTQPVAQALTTPVPAQPQKREAPAAPIRLSSASVAVTSKSAALAVRKNTPKEMVTELNSGAALFSVEPGHYKTFVVSTPDAEIQVTGTIFDVLIEAGHTQVSVLRGSVSVLYKNVQQAVSVLQNEIVSPDSGTAVPRPLTDKESEAISPYLQSLDNTPSLSSEVLTPPVEGQTALPEVLKPDAPFEAALNEGLKCAGRNDYAGALRFFEEAGKSASSGSTVQTALFEAANLKINKMGRAKEGVLELENYVTRFPKGIYLEEALTELIKACRAQGDISKLIETEERYIAQFPLKNETREYVYEAGTLLREGKKEYGRAADYYSIFMESYPRDFRSEDACFWAGKCRLAAGQKDKAEMLFNNYLSKYPQGRWASDIKQLLSR